MFKIKVPLYVTLPRKKVKDKKIWLNLNIYRNLNKFTENDCKKVFFSTIQNKLPDTKLQKINISCQIYKCATKKGIQKRLDKSNVYSVLAKYFFDSLVENGNLEDDNDGVIHTETILPTKYLEYGSEEYAEFTIQKI